MLECSICRRLYDDRFKVFVPPNPEPFDTIECARRASRASGPDASVQMPVVLPSIEPVSPRPEPRLTPTVPRRSIAALAALVLTPGQVALASGAGLFAAGTAASIYLAASEPTTTHSPSVAVGLPGTNPAGTGRGPASGSPQATQPPQPAVTRPPGAKAKTVEQGKRTRTGAEQTLLPNGSGGTSPVHDATSQLASQPVTTKQSVNTSSDAPAAAAAPAAKPSKKPKPAPETAKPSKPKPNPTPPAPAPEPTGGDTSVTTAPATVSTTSPGKPSGSKPKPNDEPPPPPPVTTPPPNPPDGDDTRPGNGCGDRNHDHTGPPGKDDDHEHGDDHGGGDDDHRGDGGHGGGDDRGRGGGDD